MRILRRANGVFECQTKELRLRLKPIMDTQKATLIIHHLKPNGYIKNKIAVEVDSPSKKAEVSKLFQSFLTILL